MGERGQIRVAVERRIAAPAPLVYDCLADLQTHHHRFLPPAFSDFAVEAGGVGAGTVVRFRLKVGGRQTSLRARVDEPTAGRRLTETYPDSGLVTAFEVRPEGEHCRVSIESAVPAASGPRGALERVLAAWLLKPIYKDELARLDRYARGRLAGSGQGGGTKAPG